MLSVRARRAFSLIELIVVIVIVAVLVAVGAVGYLSVVHNSQDTAAKTRLHQVVKAAAAAAAAQGAGAVTYLPEHFDTAASEITVAAGAAGSHLPLAASGLVPVQDGPSTAANQLSFSIDTADPTHAALALLAATGHCAVADVRGTRGEVAVRKSGPCDATDVRDHGLGTGADPQPSGSPTSSAPVALTSPTLQTPQVGSPNSTAVTLRWPAVPGAQTYSVIVDDLVTDVTATVSGGTATAVVTGLGKGTHTVIVEAQASGQDPKRSDPVTITISPADNDMVANAAEMAFVSDTTPWSSGTYSLDGKSVEPSEATPGSTSLWWKFTPKVTGTYLLKVPQTYKAINVMPASAAPAGPGSAQAWTWGTTAGLGVAMNAGTPYLIRLADNGSAGPVSFTIELRHRNDSWTNPAPVTLAGTSWTSATYDDTFAAPPETGEVTGYGDTSLWWKFTPAASGTYSVFINDDYRSINVMTQASAPAGPGTASATTWGTGVRVVAAMNAGTTYLIRSAAYSGPTGPYQVKVTLEQRNDSWTSPATITKTGTSWSSGTVDDTLTAANEAGEPAGGNTLWWEFTPAISGTYTAFVDDDYRVVTIMAKSAAPAGPGVAAATSWGRGVSVSQAMTAGVPYLIRVGTSGGPAGPYTWTLTGP